MTQLLLTTRLVNNICENNGFSFASSRTLYRRLNKLREAGLIDRSHLLQTGEYAYHLTKTGAELVTQLEGLPTLSRKALNPPSMILQMHEFEVSRFWIKFFSDSKKLHIPTLQFWRDGSFIYPARQGKLVPDGTTLLKIKGKTRVFCLEMDRSTQSRGGEVTEGGVIHRKLIRYRQLSRTFRQDETLAPFQPHALRVVFVCLTEQRLESLRLLAREMGIGNLVAFTCVERFVDISNPLTASGWTYKSANFFAAPLFSFPARPPPKPLL